jgi:hypothetical protein
MGFLDTVVKVSPTGVDTERRESYNQNNFYSSNRQRRFEAPVFIFRITLSKTRLEPQIWYKRHLSLCLIMR